MCGIAAVLFHAPDTAEWARQTLHSMLRAISHRGYSSLQEAAGAGNSFLGCVRLPVRDPIAGMQPAWNADGTVAALLNGEIYNSGQLGAAQARWNSDTALLPFIYRESKSAQANTSRLLQCRGMYAIILHDTAGPLETVVVLRDHVGIKPLFVAETERAFLLASECKAFTPYNPQSIRQVSPGELLTFAYGNSGWTQTERRDVRAELRASPGLDYDGTPASARRVISEAVSSQWPMEDLPVAVLCSGGIDSSILTFELSRHMSARQPLIAYGVRCGDARSASRATDASAGRHVCEFFGVPFREVISTYDDLISVLGDVIYHAETFEPNVVRNSAIQYHLMRQVAADGFRVAFCGEGADELFWGYADFASSNDPESLAKNLLDDLHLTQLQRVDRIGMAHTVEVRVPFLDERVYQLATQVPADRKRLTTCGMWLGKAMLREAYAGTLPDETVLRRKATLAFGAGFGGVEMNDQSMNDRAEALLQSRGQTVANVVKQFPNLFPAGTVTPERALYVHLYDTLGFKIPKGYTPPTVAKLERA